MNQSCQRKGRGQQFTICAEQPIPYGARSPMSMPSEGGRKQGRRQRKHQHAHWSQHIDQHAEMFSQTCHHEGRGRRGQCEENPHHNQHAHCQRQHGRGYFSRFAQQMTQGIAQFCCRREEEHQQGCHRQGVQQGMGQDGRQGHRCAQGNGDGRGRGGRHGGGHGCHRGGGSGRPFSPRGRRISSDELQLLVLALLSQQPYHGYQLIKAFAELSQGFYTPSPGMVYPVLTFLEESDLATVTLEGTKKSYQITSEGSTLLTENQERVEALLTWLKESGEQLTRMQSAYEAELEDEKEPDDFRLLIQEMSETLRSKRFATHDEKQRVISVLKQALNKIAD